MRLTKDKIKIYGAGKTWAAEALRDLRGQGYNIISRWIDSPVCLTSPTDTHKPEIHKNEKFKRNIWEFGCKVDCKECDFGFIIATPADKNMHSGAIAELGHITAFDKPVYIVGTCESFEPVGNSDRAWKAQSMVYHWPNITDFKEGIEKALAHYRRNYREQWLSRNLGNHI